MAPTELPSASPIPSRTTILNGTKTTTYTTKTGTPPIDPSQVAKLGMAAYRAPSLAQPHRARDALADAHAGRIPPLVGFFIGLQSPAIAKLVAQLGFDFVWIDWEHAAMTAETMSEMVHYVQFMSEGRSIPLVRVPGHDHASIGNALDAGASIIVPQVDTVSQAQHIVSAAKFGTSSNGTRSAPPMQFLPGVSDTRLNTSLGFHANLNNQAAIIIQIESITGIRNLDAILAAVGKDIDSVWLGSLDLRVSMGFDGLWGDEPEFLEAVRLYEGTLAKFNMPASGVAMGPLEAKRVMARGRSFVVSGNDGFTLLAQMAELAEVRENFKAMDYQGVYEKL